MGRPAHKPTEETRAKVRAYAMVGVPHEGIATLIETTGKTLRIHYRKELDQGKAQATATIGKTLYNAALKGNTAAMIFWMKAQAGWRETSVQQQQQLDKHGNPTTPTAPSFGVSFTDGRPGAPSTGSIEISDEIEDSQTTH